MTDFAVIQTRFETIPSETMVHVLTENGGMPHADACRVARRSQGILGDQFTQRQAQAVWKELSGQNFGVRVVPSDELPELSEPRTIRWFEIDNKQFCIPDGIRGETIPMDWISVFVISVGQIVEVNEKLVRDSKRRSNVFEKSAAIYLSEGPKYRKQGKLIDVVDLIGVDQSGGLRYLRLPSHQLVYDRILGQGTELNRFERFLVIVEFLIAQAHEAIISPNTRKILVNREPHTKMIEGEAVHLMQEESLQTYNRWLLYQAISRECEIEDSSTR